MKNSFSIDLQGNPEALKEMNAFLINLASKLNWQDSLIFKVNLIAEEFFSNIVKYGYRDNKLHLIYFTVINRDSEIELNLEDDGIEFNPLDTDEPDTDLPVEERDIGGLGIHLSKNLSKSINYQRKNEKNYIKVIIEKGD
jgi:serine/threonine-protein kinase RsbW